MNTNTAILLVLATVVIFILSKLCYIFGRQGFDDVFASVWGYIVSTRVGSRFVGFQPKMVGFYHSVGSSFVAFQSKMVGLCSSLWSKLPKSVIPYAKINLWFGILLTLAITVRKDTIKMLGMNKSPRGVDATFFVFAVLHFIAEVILFLHQTKSNVRFIGLGVAIFHLLDCATEFSKEESTGFAFEIQTATILVSALNCILLGERYPWFAKWFAEGEKNEERAEI